MPKNLIVRGCTLLGLLLIASGPTARPAHAQVATAPELKAAFLVNFAKFTTWPAAALPERGTLVLCVVGDSRVATALNDLTRGQRIGGRETAVRRLSDRDDPEPCHLLYASDLRADREAGLIEATRDRPILTASDSRSFIGRGGIAAFHIAAGRMRFSVNPDAAARAQLRISSRLLSLAVIVKDGDDVHIH